MQLLKTYERFQRFYQSKHSGRKLNWLYQISKGELKTGYLTKASYTFQVSTYQMGILLLYNGPSTNSWEELLQATGMGDEQLAAQLTLLSKAKVLLPSGTIGTPQSTYALNFDFKSKKIRLNLNIAVKSETKQETEETHKTIQEDRQYVIQVPFSNSGSYRTNHERKKNVEACQFDSRGHFSAPGQIQAPGSRHKKMH
jgi:cullin 1